MIDQPNSTSTSTSTRAPQEHPDAKPFPPRIMSVIEDIASRYANGFSGPWHDDEGPMQDDADEAIAWIAAHGDVRGDRHD